MRVLPLFSLLALGCAGLFGGKKDQRDEDGDGFSAAEDCNDNDAHVSPARPEVCDAINRDEDCDGLADDEDDSVTGTWPWYPDGDDDGWGNALAEPTVACDPPAGSAAEGGDCDDGDPAVNPEAAEDCNGLDDDCDGGVDDEDPEGPTGADASWDDRDGDGYGDLETEAYVCDTEGRADNGDDCDDRDEDVNPGAEEICDSRGVDEDCNGLVNEDDPGLSSAGQVVGYPDDDDDGYGDSDQELRGCELPPGYVSRGGDCDDGEATVNPGEVEVCEDGLDNDCDGTSGGCTLSGDVPLTSGDTAKIYGVRSGVDAGDYTQFVGDLDGDGREDLLTHLNDDDSVYLWQHVPSGSVLITSADVDITGGGTTLGASAVGRVDLTGDGRDDLVLGDWYTDGTAQGRVRVFAGPLSTSRAATDDVVTIQGTSTSSMLTMAMTGGDNDGDGRDDLYAYQNSDTSVYVFEGPLTSADTDPTDAEGRLTGLGISWSMVAQDLNGDGADDLIIANKGFYELFFDEGPISGTVAHSSAGFEIGTTSNQQFASTLAAGDLTGDGTVDVAVSAPGLGDEGGVYVLPGPFAAGDAEDSAVAVFRGATDDSLMGACLSIGDFDGDSNADLVVGAPQDSTGGSYAGALGLQFGPVTRSETITTMDIHFLGAADSLAGISCALDGDMDADGYDDLAVGSRWEDVGAVDAGTVTLYLGTGL